MRFIQGFLAVHVDVHIDHQPWSGVFGHNMMNPDHTGYFLSRVYKGFNLFPVCAPSGEKAEVFTTGDEGISEDP